MKLVSPTYYKVVGESADRLCFKRVIYSSKYRLFLNTDKSPHFGTVRKGLNTVNFTV